MLISTKGADISGRCMDKTVSENKGISYRVAAEVGHS